MTAPIPPQARRLVRSQDRMVAGVCAGVADYFGLDPTLVRVLTVVLGVVFCPVVPIVYAVLWAVVPKH
jgi:phage shock protein PspC (stress-responsive transcriptional regulator)